MKLPKFEKKLRREDLFAISITMILMWAINIDTLWGMSHLFVVLSVFYIIAIHYILNEKTFEKDVLVLVLKFIIFSETLLSLISAWAIYIVTSAAYGEISILFNLLYIFPFITFIQSLTIFLAPRKLIDEKVDKNSLLFTFFVILGVLLIARYFNYMAFIAGSMALGTNAIMIKIKDWFEAKKI